MPFPKNKEVLLCLQKLYPNTPENPLTLAFWKKSAKNCGGFPIGDVHPMRNLRRFVSIGSGYGSHPAHVIRHDPSRDARRCTPQQHPLDVRLLLPLHGALPAGGAHHRRHVHFKEHGDPGQIVSKIPLPQISLKPSSTWLKITGAASNSAWLPDTT